MDFLDFIKDKRPNLSASSVKTYNSVLSSLYKKVFGYNKGDSVDNEMFSKKSKDILNFLKDLPPNRRKTILSALVVITDKKDYRDAMLEDINNYNADIKKQEKTETQRDSWVEDGELNTIFNDLKKNADLLYKKQHLLKTDYQQIQNFILIALLGGFFCPPRRSLDYASFKIKNIDKEHDNFIDKGHMVFNRYKTAKTYGEQRVKIPPALNAILKKWIKVNPTEYLFFDSNMNPLSSVKITQRLNKIFGKKASVNSLRHSYLTSKYGEMIKKNSALAEDMQDMGSSINMATTYIKND